jgi:hypothetical protein
MPALGFYPAHGNFGRVATASERLAHVLRVGIHRHILAVTDKTGVRCVFSIDQRSEFHDGTLKLQCTQTYLLLPSCPLQDRR